MDKVSIIICTKDSGKYLEEVIKSAKASAPFEIIVVDANSVDNTEEICKKTGVKLIYDNGMGLGNARNIGLKEAKGNYILYLGSDNVLYSGILDNLIKTMKSKKWSGIGIRTIQGLTIHGLPIKTKFNFITMYFRNAMNERWENKIKPGECKTIGTPFMFKRKDLLKYKFNPDCKYSDDTELCERMGKDGHKFGYTQGRFCLDIWQGIKASVSDRFVMYGKSDREYFKSHYKTWSIIRIIKSLLHPFSELKSFKGLQGLKNLLFSLYIIVKRYQGYISDK